MTHTQSMNAPFETLGFFSFEVDHFRATERVRLKSEFENLEQTVATAIAELRSMTGMAAPAYLVGAAFWLRCIESCQGTVLLAERGLATASFAPLRTAYECLFAASALWRRPEVADKMEAWHHEERIKQARQMLTEGAETRVEPVRLIELKAIAAEQLVPSGWSHWEAACAADLKFEYAMAYRGLGIAGAHASPRSLDDFHDVQADGSFDLDLSPRADRLGWLLGVVATCMRCGIQRHREARSSLT